MFSRRLQAAPLRVQAKASSAANGMAASSASAGEAAAKSSVGQRRPRGKAAAAPAKKTRSSAQAALNVERRQASAANKQRQWWQQQQQQALSQHLDKHVPAPFQGTRGNLRFSGELRFAASHKEADAWLDELLQLADVCSSSSSPLVVGIDTETAVIWGAKQQNTPTSLMQLCYHVPGSAKPVCLLLALHRLGLTRRVLRVLQHPGILKVGIGIAHDMMDLLRSYEVQAAVQGMLDLSWLATQCDVLKEASSQDAARQQEMHARGIKTFQQPLQWGLAGLLQTTSEFSLAKNSRITRSNWAKIPLSEQQLQYAACDAYAGLMTFHALQLVWLQQPEQQAAAAAAVPPEQLPATTSSSSSSRTQASLGGPVRSSAELEGFLDWLLDGDQQQQQQQSELQQQASDTSMVDEPQLTAASSSSSFSSSITTMRGAVAAAAGPDAAEDVTSCSSPTDRAQQQQQQQQQQQRQQMPFTVQQRHLTDGAFWCSYAPAVHQQQQWQQLLQRGTGAAQLQYESMLANALDKAAVADGSDYDLARPGAGVVEAAADAAAGGLLWP